jgi:hypothetical protein
MFGIPRPNPRPHAFFQVADDLVGNPGVDALLFGSLHRCHRPFHESGHQRIYDAVRPARNDPGAVFEQTAEALERFAANYAWMANTSAHTRLRWNSRTGHNPGAGGSRSWRLEDKTFCRAKTRRHVTVAKSP